jgi:hypothetical protein
VINTITIRPVTGNTIDFFVAVLGKPFNQAMEAVMSVDGC